MALDRCPRVVGRLAFVLWAYNYRAILLPLTTAASFPLVTLILLGVFVAQAVRRDLTAKDGTPVQAHAASVRQGS